MPFRGQLAPTQDDLREDIAGSEGAAEGEIFKLGESGSHGLPTGSQVSGLSSQERAYLSDKEKRTIQKPGNISQLNSMISKTGRNS